ncbi:head-tail connector protein [Aurantimonas endophytica]|uniref:Putative phiE125 gp8 family phage protein n=1 Tax=Aurantimonas endophytica TaxID=1522175 RepID=A0A7W6HAF4_9HYPH|nr:head-tail connector protein [Aurantimonas endophytica]MBB4001589.1 putative phiE125 gp8 family phage protein [Aurantimonas endophytica]MCO6402771.1 phage gp6-like head-tail connector protein [Aurantimonas endophytica]
MRVVVITPPEPILSWDEAKAHLRLDDDEERVYVESLIAAAQGWIDGPDGWLGRSVGLQTLEFRACGFSRDLLPYRPIVSVESVTYLDRDGEEQVIDPASYEIRNGYLLPATGTSWPWLYSDDEAVRIRYVTGQETPPAAIKQAMLLLIAQWFSFRSNVAEDGAPAELPMAVEALLNTYRVWS